MFTEKVNARYPSIVVSERIQAEDVAICERVQTSHQAGYAPPGRLLPRSEEAVQHFQKVILGLLAA